jgi:hypothetical protein
MAIECTRCGGLMMSETVIKLRRGVLGYRETRFQGAYCATCRLSVPVECPSRAQAAISVPPRTSLRGFLPMWLRGGTARSMGAIRFAQPGRRNWTVARMPS